MGTHALQLSPILVPCSGVYSNWLAWFAVYSQLAFKLKLIPLYVLCQKVKQISLSISCRDLISTKGLKQGDIIGKKKIT